MQIVIDTAQTKITVKDQCFFIQSKTAKRQISPKRITSIAITSNATINASAIILAAENQVPILYFDRLGKIKAKLWSPYFSNLASLRRKQLLWSVSEKATQFIFNNLLLKFDLQLENIKMWAGKGEMSLAKVEVFEKAIKTTKDKFEDLTPCAIIKVRSELMGLEGGISRKYWSILSELLPEAYRFSSRSRRPAKDYFNAALNYIYGMTYAEIEQAVFAAGMDPMIGALHTENYYKPALVYDLIEPFRPLIDRMLIALCQKNALEAIHFQGKEKGFWLSKLGKKLIIPAYNDHLKIRISFDQKVQPLQAHFLTYCHKLSKTLKTFTDDLPD